MAAETPCTDCHESSERRAAARTFLALINGTRGFACLAGYRTMDDALQAMGDAAPDVMLVDIGLPGVAGIDAFPILREPFVDMPILTLTIYDDHRGFEALGTGVTGQRRVVPLFREFRTPNRPSYRLTSQETELLKLLVDGHHYKTAAEEMRISINTISFHLKNIYVKLQVHSKSEAVAKALRERLV